MWEAKGRLGIARPEARRHAAVPSLPLFLLNFHAPLIAVSPAHFFPLLFSVLFIVPFLSISAMVIFSVRTTPLDWTAVCAYEFVLIATFSCYSLSVLPLNLSYICVCACDLCYRFNLAMLLSIYICTFACHVRRQSGEPGRASIRVNLTDGHAMCACSC